MLFGGTSLAGWRMSTIRNQPGRDDPGRFILVEGALEAVTGDGPWAPLAHDTHARRFRPQARVADLAGRRQFPGVREVPRSGRQGLRQHGLRRRRLRLRGPDRPVGQPDGVAIHKTGAVYAFQPPSSLPVNPLGQWNAYEITVQGQHYTVTLNGVPVTDFTFVPGSDAVHPDRGLPSTVAMPRFIGLQTHIGRVAFRKIQIKAI